MTATPPTTDPHCGVLAVVGVGLLGGSVAMAARSRGLARRIIGIGRNLERLAAARAAGVIDSCAADLAAAGEADVVVVCTPVDRLADDVQAAAERTAADAVVTDVGSIKGAIVRQLAGTAAAGKYVPAHPLAGSEQAGWQAGSGDLFQDRLCVLTPFPGIDSQRLQRIDAFWRGLGMRTTQLDPDEHDRLLAVTSHLPHAAAAALAALVGDTERPFAATGFRDATRIAAGDPAVWTPILLGNATQVLKSLDRLESELAEFRAALERQDADALTRWLDIARERRNALNHERPAP